MLKKILIVLCILFLLIWSAVFYLNKVVFPVKIKSLIINSAQELTGKKVSCDEVKISIFKGLVVRNFNLYDNKKVILSIKEVNCTFLFFPLVKRQVIIPRINIVSPSLFLERRMDNTFNVMKPFTGKKPAAGVQSRYNLIVYGVSVSGAKVSFQDDTINPVFTKEIQSLKVNLSLSLPARVKFVFSGQIPAKLPMKLAGQGEYNISSQELSAKIGLKDFVPAEFEPYLNGLGVVFGKGKIDYLGSLTYKDQVVSSDFTLSTSGLSISRDKLLFILNSTSKVNLKYGFNQKHCDFSGKTEISEGFLYGLPNDLGQVDKIFGSIRFNNEGVFADNLEAFYSQIPFKAKITLLNFKSPFLSLDLSAQPALEAIQKIAVNNFKVKLPCDISGDGALRLRIEDNFQPNQPVKIEGNLALSGAEAYFAKNKTKINSIVGNINFTAEKISWNNLSFNLWDADYKTNGSLQSFASPQVDLELFSRDLELDTSFKINSQVINFSRLGGKYLNSDFSFLGKADLTDPDQPLADIYGKINLELNELAQQLKKMKVKIGDLAPKGLVNIQGQLKGNIKDIKNCDIKAKLSSTYVSLYGLRLNDFLADVLFTNAVADMESLHFLFYGGTINAKATVNLKNKSMPYWLDLSAQNVDLAKLIQDSAMKEKKISGQLSGDMKLSGISDDLAKMAGSGKVLVTKGSLWELDLFKGMGVLLFSRDFKDIVFSDGSCSFAIADKNISSDNILLESPVCLMKGRARIGFDSTVDAELNVEVSQDAPLTGTVKDVTTAILSNASRFGSIGISGTLKNPKFKFKASVKDIIQGIADTFLNKQ